MERPGRRPRRSVAAIFGRAEDITNESAGAQWLRRCNRLCLAAGLHTAADKAEIFRTTAPSILVGVKLTRSPSWSTWSAEAGWRLTRIRKSPALREGKCLVKKLETVVPSAIST